MENNTKLVEMAFINAHDSTTKTVDELLLHALGHTVVVDATVESLYIRVEVGKDKEVWTRPVGEDEVGEVDETRRQLSDLFKGTQPIDPSNFTDVSHVPMIRVAQAIEAGLITHVTCLDGTRMRTGIFSSTYIPPEAVFPVKLDHDGDISFKFKGETGSVVVTGTGHTKMTANVDAKTFEAFVEEKDVEDMALLTAAAGLYAQRPDFKIGDTVVFNPKLDYAHKPGGFTFGVVVDVYQANVGVIDADDAFDEWTVNRPDLILGYRKPGKSKMTLLPVDSKYLLPRTDK